MAAMAISTTIDALRDERIRSLGLGLASVAAALGAVGPRGCFLNGLDFAAEVSHDDDTTRLGNRWCCWRFGFVGFVKGFQLREPSQHSMAMPVQLFTLSIDAIKLRLGVGNDNFVDRAFQSGLQISASFIEVSYFLLDRIHFKMQLRATHFQEHLFLSIFGIRFKRPLQAINDFGVEAFTALVRRLMKRSMEFGRNAQCRPDVVVLGHAKEFTRRLQNSVDTKMKPIYISITASF